MFPTKSKTNRSDRLAKFSASINALSSIRFARADSSLLEWTQTEKWSLERTQISLDRTQTEKWLLEQIHIRSSVLIQRAGLSSKPRFARANASENWIPRSISLLLLPFISHLPPTLHLQQMSLLAPPLPHTRTHTYF